LSGAPNEKRLGFVGFCDCKRPAGKRERLDNIALLQQQATKIAINVDELRLKRERAPIMCASLLAATASGQRHTEITVHFRRFRLSRENPQIKADGLAEASLSKQQICQAILRLHSTWIERQRLPICGVRIVKTLLLGKHVAKASVGDCVVRLQRDRLAEMARRIFELTNRPQCLRQVEMAFGTAPIARKCAAKKVNCVWVSGGLQRDDAGKMQRVKMVAINRKSFSAQAFALAWLSGAVMLESRSE